MPEWSAVEFIISKGAWAISLMALALLWVHNRDDQRMYARIDELESDMGEFEKFRNEQRTANTLSAAADAELKERIAEIRGLLTAVVQRVDATDRNVVSLATIVELQKGRIGV